MSCDKQIQTQKDFQKKSFRYFVHVPKEKLPQSSLILSLSAKFHCVNKINIGSEVPLVLTAVTLFNPSDFS